MDPKAVLINYKEKVDSVLKDFFDRKIEQNNQISPMASQMAQDLADFSMRGGKRFRAALIYYGYKLFYGQNEQAIIQLSAFIELIQTFLLIHDDIMDRSDLRRNAPTLHKKYEQFSEEHHFMDDQHFGISMGILVGDLGEQYAFEIIADSDFPSDLKNQVLKLVTQEAANVCYGQVYDLLLDYNYPPDYTKADIFRIYQYKTTAYTFKLPLQTGAILAGASAEEIAQLDSFAQPCGLAFQIQDDILGVFGDTSKTGKDIKSDILEGKKTILVNQAMLLANPAQKDRLRQIIGKKDLSSSEFEEVKQIFKDTGALNYALEICNQQIQAAKQALSKLPEQSIDQSVATLLNQITDYIIARSI